MLCVGSNNRILTIIEILNIIYKDCEAIEFDENAWFDTINSNLLKSLICKFSFQYKYLS